MRRLSKMERAKIATMVATGHTLKEIAMAVRSKKTTVYYWVRKIRGKRIFDVAVDESNMESVGEVIGAFAGDGSANVDKGYKYVVRLFLSKKTSTHKG